MAQRVIPVYGDREALAYTAVRMQKSYAVLERVLQEIQRRRPTFAPESILDFGSGPGTAFHVAWRLWSNSIQHMQGVDLSESMNMVAMRLLELAQDQDDEDKSSQVVPPLDKISLRRHLSLQHHRDRHDVVVSAFCLNELPSDAAQALVIKTLWERTRKTLVLIEDGTPEGFRTIVNARHFLLDLEQNQRSSRNEGGIRILAPCPHHQVCPLVDRQLSWCHFKVRSVMNSEAQKVMASKTNTQLHDFSYIVLERPGDAQQKNAEDVLEGKPRVLWESTKAPKRVMMRVCAKDGLKKLFVGKPDLPQHFKDARKISWGDVWPHPYSREEEWNPK